MTARPPDVEAHGCACPRSRASDCADARYPRQPDLDDDDGYEARFECGCDCHCGTEDDLDDEDDLEFLAALRAAGGEEEK